jgi:prepilin-type N-terminal cleavage/methylation domain-containing protein
LTTLVITVHGRIAMEKPLLADLKLEARFAASRPKRGFTLIEMLCVLAILGALAALLFPVFAAARASAYGSTCLSNLRQLGQVTQMYVDDWEGAYPFAFSPRFQTEVALGSLGDPHGVVERQPDYTRLLQPYLKPRGVLHCPADTGLSSADGHGPLYPAEAFAAWGTSYDYSADVPEAYLGMPPFGGGSPADPSRTPLFQDTSNAWHGEADPGAELPGVYQVVYADLHAKRVPAQQVMWEVSNAYIDPFEHP